MLFRALSRAHGVSASICDARELEVVADRLCHRGQPIDLVYNRLTDFALEQLEHAALAEALARDLAVVTPHPRAYALYADKRRLALLSDADALRHRAPAGAEWLDAAALADREPAFAGHHGALLHPHDGAVDNLLLMDALERAVAGDASITRVSADVLSIDADQPSALTPTRGRFFSTRLVVCSGAWAGGLAGLPRRIAVRPVRGQLLRLAHSPIRHVTYGAGGYLVPRGDTLLVGATSEEAGFENETSLAGLATLRNIASRAIPSLASALVVDHWAGLRPMSLDTHPILGADPESPALVYACGYSRNGILFAPWAAAQLANVLVGDPAPELAPFRVDRPALSAAA